MQQGKPIAYFSRSLGVRNAATSTYDKEALAILEALKRWRYYFLDSDLIIKTDHNSQVHYRAKSSRGDTT
jgi:hypothetical protein